MAQTAKITRWFVVLSLLLVIVLGQPIHAQDTLMPDQPLTGTLDDSPQTYPLAIDPEIPFVIEISGLDVYAYLMADGQAVSPFNTETQDQNGMLLTRQAYTGVVSEAQVILEGHGAYTLTLKDNAEVANTIAVLGASDVIDDELFPDETHRYLLDAKEDKLLTLTIGTKQRSFYARVVNGAGETLSPLLSLPDENGFHDLIAVRGPAPYSLYLSGVGDYTAFWEAGDTLSSNSATLTLDNAIEAASGIGHYTFDTQASVISVVLDEFEAETALIDQAGTHIASSSRFYDQPVRQRIVVYPLTGHPPYTLLVQSINTYTLTLREGDASQVDQGTLALNSTASANVPVGRTPLYTLNDGRDQPLILTLFYDPSTLRTSPPFTLISSDGQTTQPTRLWAGSNQLQTLFTPQGAPPYRLVLALSGPFSLSLVQRQVAGVEITLTTVDTNLRSGPTINAEILRKGQPGETYTAIGRSADDAWLLVLTAEDTAMWVYRQLVETAPGATLANLPLVQAASVGAEIPSTPLPSATATIVIVTVEASQAPSATPIPTQRPSSTPISTATLEPTMTITPAPIVCRIVSQGGVNVRHTPSTSGDIAGSLNDGQTAAVVGQFEDAAGRVWWQLSDLTWVRSDVVGEQGDCTLAPTVVMPR